jgi:hypothetical protein
MAEWSPASTVTQAARELFGIQAGTAEPTAWPLQNATVYALLWVGLVIGLFAPLSVRRHRRAGTKQQTAMRVRG